jgi:hypothetical protein
MTEFNFGFEIETVSPLHKVPLSDFLNRRAISTVVAEFLPSDKKNDYIYDGSYSLVDDNSIQPKFPNYGVEVRSGLFSLDRLDSHRPLFVALREFGVTANARCGLHIHASSQDGSPIDAAALVEATKHESVRVGRKRKTYSIWEGPNSHYRAVNQRSPSHVEFRWFNGSVDFRYLCRMVRLINKYCKLEVSKTVLRMPSLSVPG